jgi:hypothetical protein
LVAIASCGGVRERLARQPSPATQTFDDAELIDVLPPDRIDSIDRPRFEAAAAAREWLRPDSPVVALELAGDARAYPLAILVWHEVVNDVVGGRAIVITYGPLYDSAAVFDRPSADRADTFGVSGKLYRSDLVLFDRETRSLWPQALGRAVRGPREGLALTRVASQITSLGEFVASYPAGTILSRETGSLRAYGFNPYEGYDSRDAPFAGFFARRTDPRLAAMERVVGLMIGGESRAYPYSALSGPGVVSDRVGGRDVVVLWRGGTRSAVDARAVERGRDVGSAGAFTPVVEGRRLDVEPAAGGFRDLQTGSTWTVLGVATAGPLAGRRLERVDHRASFWFAWASSVPGTSIYEG